MKIVSLLLFLFPFYASASGPCHGKEFKIVLHGGAGAGKKPVSVHGKMKAAAQSALRLGYKMAKKGEPSEKVVMAVVSSLEDSPYLNAGRGAIQNEAGFVELDASIMRGRDRNAGAVAAVRTIKNPIKAAYAVMNQTRHVFFVDRGADELAKSLGLEIVKNSYFKTSQMKGAMQKESVTGTVGAVVLDRCGDISAGTSTGGFVTKIPGRVGDSPIIGAGTFADNESCAVSGTGHGEIFIRWSAAYDTCALVKYKGWNIQRASQAVIDKVKKGGAQSAGLIVINRKGDHAWPFSSQGMLRGVIDQTGRGLVALTSKGDRFYMVR